MTEQVEEIYTINITYLVVKKKDAGGSSLNPFLIHSSHFFLRKTNPIDISTQRGSKSVNTKGQAIFCTRILAIINDRNFGLEVLVSL